MKIVDKFLRKRGWVTRNEMDSAVSRATAKATAYNAETLALANQTRQTIAAYRALELTTHKERTRWLSGTAAEWLSVNEHAIHLAEAFLLAFDEDDSITATGAAEALRAFLSKRREVDDFDVKLKFPATP